MKRMFNLKDKPYELKTKEEIARDYEEATGEKYTEPTEEEKQQFLK